MGCRLPGKRARSPVGTSAPPTQCKTLAVSAQEIDDYLAALDEPKRATLEALRRSILDVAPQAEQCISYGMPAFKLHGTTIAGFAAFKHHLSYLPHSGSVLPALAPDLAGYEMTKGSLHFAIDKPLPKRLVKQLITTRLRQLGATGKAPDQRRPRSSTATGGPT